MRPRIVVVSCLFSGSPLPFGDPVAKRNHVSRFPELAAAELAESRQYTEGKLDESVGLSDSSDHGR